MTILYNHFKRLLVNGGIDLDSDTIEMALLSDSVAYSPDIDNESYVSDVLATATEFTDASYSRQSVAITTSTDTANDRAVVDANDVVFAGLDGDTIQSAILYKAGADDTSSPLIAHLTSTEFPLPANGGDVTIQINADGLLTLS